MSGQPTLALRGRYKVREPDTDALPCTEALHHLCGPPLRLRGYEALPVPDVELPEGMTAPPRWRAWAWLGRRKGWSLLTAEPCRTLGEVALAADRELRARGLLVPEAHVLFRSGPDAPTTPPSTMTPT
jgi:hypothetical protein